MEGVDVLCIVIIPFLPVVKWLFTTLWNLIRSLLTKKRVEPHAHAMDDIVPQPGTQHTFLPSIPDDIVLAHIGPLLLEGVRSDELLDMRAISVGGENLLNVLLFGMHCSRSLRTVGFEQIGFSKVTMKSQSSCTSTLGSWDLTFQLHRLLY